MNPDGLIHRRREDLHRDSDRMDGRQDGGEGQVETGRQHHRPRDNEATDTFVTEEIDLGPDDDGNDYYVDNMETIEEEEPSTDSGVSSTGAIRIKEEDQSSWRRYCHEGGEDDEMQLLC